MTMITVYLRSGDLAELSAQSVETRAWDLGNGTVTQSLVCLDEEGNVVGQFFLDAISGWAVSLEEVFDFEDEEDE